MYKRINTQVLIYDNRGIGDSDVPPGPYSIEIMCKDLLELINIVLNDYELVDIFGVSMGGCIAQMAAIKTPSLIRKIILGCTTPGGNSIALGKGLLENLRLFSDPKILKNKSSREIFLQLQTPNFPPWWIELYPEFFEQYIIDLMRYKRTIDGILSQSQGLMKFNLSKLLSKLTQSTLIIHGNEDSTVPFEAGLALSKLIPNSKIIILDHASHNFWITHFSQTIILISEFLMGNSGKSKL